MNATFPIDLAATTPLLGRFHRKVMDRQNLDWDSFDASAYSAETREHARIQWAGRAVAEYLSTAQFGQLLHRMTLVGTPIELIGAATRMVQDECRHAELCARMADLLGGRTEFPVTHRGLSLFDSERDPWIAIYRTVLEVCCFGEVLSVPMLRSIETAAHDPLARTIANIIGNDEEYHARFGWEALAVLTPRLDEQQKAHVQGTLPEAMGHFERICVGSPELIAERAGQEIVVEEREGNLGTLTDLEYAAIFYDTIANEIIPNLEALGFEAMDAWRHRVVPTAPASAQVAAAEIEDL